MAKTSLGSPTLGASDLPIQRLLAYQQAIAGLRGRDRVTVGELLEKLADVSRETLSTDLKQLAISDVRSIDIRELDRRARQQTNRALSAGIEPRVEISGHLVAEELSKLLLDPNADNLSRAQAKEGAFAFAQVNPESFLFALGSMVDQLCAYQHQVTVCKKITEQMHGCGMVADEVGLGKTITGGLVLLELLHRNLVRTSLILVPSNLLNQWSAELKDFFDFRPVSVRGENAASLSALDRASHLLLDLDKAKTKPYRDVLLHRTWDCLLVDEAHRLRNHDTERSRFCYSLQAKFRVFLTATPVHNSAFDIFTEVTSLRPGALGHRDAFRDLHVREDGSIYDPSFLQKKLEQTVTRTRRGETGLHFAERDILHVPIKHRTAQEKALYSDLLHFLRNAYRRHLRGAVPINLPPGTVRHVEAFVLVAIMVLREMGSHPRAALATLDTALRRRLDKLAAITGDYADVDALANLVQTYSHVEWKAGTHGKTDELVNQLSKILRDSDKCIIYTEFLATLEALEKRIKATLGAEKDPSFDLVIYKGGMPRRLKDASLDRFRTTPKPCVLLSTDCGGEGLNLHVAGAVVNYDFPWNPMRIEQRIGRIDRIRQERRRISIHNFVTEGTIEAYVYAVLQEKLEVCRDIIGSFSSPITRLMLRRPEDLGIGEIILSCEDDEEMAKRFDSFNQDIDFLLKETESYGPQKDVWF